MKLTSIIIVNYKTAKLSNSLIENIQRHFKSPLEIIVVDNSGEFENSKVKVITTNSNLGYARGVNRAVKMAKGEYLLLINPDCSVFEDILTPLINHLDKTKANIVSPKICKPSGQIIPGTYNQWPSYFSTFQEFCLPLDYLLQKTKLSWYHKFCKSVCKPKHVIGTCLLIRKSTFLHAGGFNEDYFLYREETDLCERLGEVWYFPSVSVIHHKEKSVRKDFSRAVSSKYYIQSTYIYLRKRKKNMTLLWYLVIFAQTITFMVGFPLLILNRKVGLSYILSALETFKNINENWH